MFYSVIWSTENRLASTDGPIDLKNKQELWLAKLGSWTEALAVYQEKLKDDPTDFEAMLGCMRCLDASGEWRKVLHFFEEHLATMSVPSVRGHLQLREDIAPRSKRKALRMCAHAAWRLSQWDDLEKFSSELVRGLTAPQYPTASTTTPIPSSDTGFEFDGNFYSAVLHIHRCEWPEAAEAIDGARKAMDGRLTALMAESYSRAYPSLVTAQTLAEMEEVLQFQKLVERSKMSAHQHPANRPNEQFARQRLLSVWRDRLAGCRVDAEVHASILAVRSLVLGPGEEVEATLKLSALSRQAGRYKFAERVLLRPLSDLSADLNGPAFNLSLGRRVDFASLDRGSLIQVIDRCLAGDLSFVVPEYGPNHEQWSKSLVADAGGLEK